MFARKTQKDDRGRDHEVAKSVRCADAQHSNACVRVRTGQTCRAYEDPEPTQAFGSPATMSDSISPLNVQKYAQSTPNRNALAKNE